MSQAIAEKPKRKQVKNRPPLTDEQQAMVLEMMPNADVTARTALRKYARLGVDYDELLSSAHLGLCTASRTWRPGKGASWKTYAVDAMRHAIINYLPGNGVATREALVRAAARGQRLPSVCSVTVIADTRDGRMPRDRDITNDESPRGSLDATNRVAAELLTNAEHLLTDLEKTCLRMRLLDGMSCIEIARQMGSKRTAVHQTTQRAIHKIKQRAGKLHLDELAEELP